MRHWGCVALAESTQGGLRVLLTNNTLAGRAGSELYVRDLAISLMKRGHSPIAYSTVLGDVAEELRRATVPVIDDLGALNVAPDVIHGQHHLETTIAALRFPGTPVVHVCHGWLPWEELPTVLPNIKRYVAVDELCRERLLTSKGITAAQVDVHLNFVDLDRFQLRLPLPKKPESALVFSNYANENAMLAAIRGACHRFGIGRVDVVGGGSGNSVTNPEDLVGKYDVVFAKARCALEAMASGCAVIVADYAGLGGLVTTENAARMRRLNFGARTMQNARVSEENILRELSLYNAENARQVSEWIRVDADMASAVTRWIALYREILANQPQYGSEERAVHYEAQLGAASEYLCRLSPIVKARGEVEQRLRQAQAMESALRGGQAELDASRVLLGQREAELREIYVSRAWKAIQRYRAMRAWLRELGT